jgi:hypothetical protein
MIINVIITDGKAKDGRQRRGTTLKLGYYL